MLSARENYCPDQVTSSGAEPSHPTTLRATNRGLHCIKRGGWHALWNFIFNVTLVNSFLLSDYKEVCQFQVDLQKALLKRSIQIPPKHVQTLDTSPDLELQHHKLASQLPQQYCSVCTNPPDGKQKRVVLGEISGNCRSKDA
jgi:hypothetical protein